MKLRLFLMLALMTIVAGKVCADNVTFTECSWDDTKKEVIKTKVTKDCTHLTGWDEEGWQKLGEEGKVSWYYVDSYVKLKVFTIVGEVHLVLKDNPTVKLAHIKLEAQVNAKLYVHNVDGDDKGTINVTNYNIRESYDKSFGYYTQYHETYFRGAAVIGGGEWQNMGSLFVHGGSINVKNQDKWAAAIGGGRGGNIDSNHQVVVYAGRINAEAFYTRENSKTESGTVISLVGVCEPYGAVIGGSDDNAQGGRVTVYGGTVRAENKGRGAAIGGGEDASGGSVYVYGGSVYAAAGLYSKKGGTGIGGGYQGSGGDVHIYGGTVEVIGGMSCSAIGGYGDADDHSKGSIEFAPNMRVTAGASIRNKIVVTEFVNEYKFDHTEVERVFTSFEREAACMYRNWAKVEPCDHTTPTKGSDTTEAVTYTIKNDTHTMHCRYCTQTVSEAHTFVENKCKACGKTDDTNDDLWSVTLYRASAAGSTGYADHVVMKVVKDQPFTIPAVNATQGLTLMGYAMSWTEDDGIEMKDSEKLTAVGEDITPITDINYYPRYRYRYVPTWTWDHATRTATLSIKCSALSSDAISVTNITYEAEDGKMTATGIYEHNGATYTFTNTCVLPLEQLELSDNASNEGTISKYIDRTVNKLTLSGRTLWKDNSWNTLCLPFDVDDISSTPLAGATIKTLALSSFADDGTLTLDFSDVTTSLSAGKPYLVKWTTDGNSYIESPVFNNVTIREVSDNSVSTMYINLEGSFSPVTLEANDQAVLYLGADNTLYYPSEAMTVNACRAVFRLHNGITAGDLTTSGGANVRRFVLNFGDGEEATAIVSVSEELGSQGAATGWYTLDGRRLNDQPIAKGLYIHNGRKVFIVK